MDKDQKDYKSYHNYFTENARQSIENAHGIAKRMGATYIGTEHILLGILQQDSSIGAKVLKNAGVTYDRAKVSLSLTPRVLTNTSARGLSEMAKLTLEISTNKAQDFGQKYCGTEHILYAILSQNKTRATKLLSDMNIDLKQVKGELQEYLSNQKYSYEDRKVKTRRSKGGKTPAIDHFGTDLTAKAHQNELDPVVGRDRQIQRMITILNRRTKNNPVLIGDPGVGKTAIVEGLAQRIVTKEAPHPLHEKRIIGLDLSSVIAGTKYRGEFEERLRRILDEIQDNDDIIVFIDELHLIVGAGAAEGAIDAGNILKPALARGKIRVIGATTIDEYRKHIDKDSALERRFQTIEIPEATNEETTQILRGLKEHYEDFHGVGISEEVIDYTVKLADRYLQERFFPDKAIDLMDEAAAQLRINQPQPKDERLKELEENLRNVEREKSQAVDGEDYETAAKLKAQAQSLRDQIDERTDEQPASELDLEEDDIAQVVADITGVPITKLVKADAQQLIKLDDRLKQHIIGQDEAIASVAQAIRRNRSGVSDINRPIGSFLFMGPTGVGKTELAKVLAAELYHSEDALIKIDMSEFMERHNVSRLLGAPAGYVGHDEGGQLTEQVRRRPYSLILLDEIEKAHPDVFNMLLQILEDGVISDAKGRKVDFTNTVIIMTSNIGAERLYKEAVLGFRPQKQDNDKDLDTLHQQNKEKVMEDLKETMRPELINRIDKMVVFRALSESNVEEILELRLGELRDRLLEQGIGLKLTYAAKQHLVEAGYEPKLGVRPLRRAVEEQIEDPIATGILKSHYEEGDLIKVRASQGDLEFEKAEE